jgi:phosphohistidine phosphatase SixA
MRFIALFLCLLARPALANDWDALREPGAVAIMRHALAPGTGDPANFTLDDCNTQRNLDARGRAQARQIGEALRERGLTFDAVLSSQWCRAMETAELLGLGAVDEAPVLNSFFRNRSTRDAQTSDLQTLLRQQEGRLMLVTHFVNVRALTGQGARSGEILVIRMAPDGIEVLGRIRIEP